MEQAVMIRPGSLTIIAWWQGLKLGPGSIWGCISVLEHQEGRGSRRQWWGYPTLRGLKLFSPKEWPNLKAAAVVLSTSPVRAASLGWADGKTCGKPEHMGLCCMVVRCCSV